MNVIEIVPLLQWIYFYNNKRMTRHKKSSCFEAYRISEIKHKIIAPNAYTETEIHCPILTVINNKSADILKFRR